MLKKENKRFQLKSGRPIYIEASMLQKMVIIGNFGAEHKMLKFAIIFAQPNFLLTFLSKTIVFL